MNVETFIRNATRGLSRRKRAEAQAELRSHLHERTNQLILLGKPLPSAQAQAMQELGAPGEIARGLRRTEHVHPLLSAGALTALAGVLLWPAPYVLWERLTGEIYKSVGTISGTATELKENGYLPLAEVQRQLGEFGIQLLQENDSYLLRRAGLPDAPLGQDKSYRCLPPLLPEQGHLTLNNLMKLPLFIETSSLVNCMARANWPLNVSPISISLEQQNLPLSWGAQYGTTNLLTQAYLPSLTSALKQLPTNAWQGDSNPEPLVIPFTTGNPNPTPPAQLNLAANTPVLALVKAQSWHHDGSRRTPLPTFKAALLWTNARGQLELPQPLDGPPLQLYSTRQAWLDASRTENATVLLKLTAHPTAKIELTPLSTTRRD
ncbi:permease prefix domain 1-containing protein [Deinococcus sp. VB142]|uniref:Permease prefix domain 1-containing protein n=1 Tax=Deinococcus sp. VB142 TaxID=3112952 RepID=A0AAU6Q1M4_9DEIO